MSRIDQFPSSYGIIIGNVNEQCQLPRRSPFRLLLSVASVWGGEVREGDNDNTEDGTSGKRTSILENADGNNIFVGKKKDLACFFADNEA